MNRVWTLFLLLALLLLGCGGGSTTVTPDTVNFSYVADLNSASTNLKQLNGGTVAIGWNRLVGTSTLNGQPVDVEMLGNVDYVNGSGDFFGFLTVTQGDGSMISMRMDGKAVRNAETGDTAFTCDLKIVGGTGTYLNATGTGHFTGFRDSALGGTVHIDVKANVK